MKFSCKKIGFFLICISLLMTSVLGNGVFATSEVFGILGDSEDIQTDEFGAPLRSLVVSNKDGFLHPRNTFSIPINELVNFFAVYGKAQLDNGTAQIITQSNNLRIVVDGGNPEVKTGTISEYMTSDVDMFPDTITQPGTVYNPQNPYFAGVLKKDGESYFDNGKYVQWYSITDVFNYYYYSVTIQYTENVPSDITISSPTNNLFTNKNELIVEGDVKDKNNGDKIDVFYSIEKRNNDQDDVSEDIKDIEDDESEDIEDENGILDEIIKLNAQPLIIENCTETYTVLAHPFAGSIDISKLEDGDYIVNFWALDKSQTSSEIITILFTIDRTPPAKPIITQHPDEDVPTNESVIIEIEYPDDPAEKKYKIGEDDDWKDYEGPFEVDENVIIYTQSEDEAGNESEIAEHEVTNIDTTPPGPPIITTSADSTVEQPINVTIEPGVDEGSGINRVEYRLYDATKNIEIEIADSDEAEETRENEEDDKAGNNDQDSENDEAGNDDQDSENDEDGNNDQDSEDDEDGNNDQDNEDDATNQPKWSIYKGEFEITRIGKTRIIARTIDNAGNISEEATKDVVISKKPAPSPSPSNPSPSPSNPPKDDNKPPGGGGGAIVDDKDDDDDKTITEPDEKVPGATTGSPVDLAVFLYTDKSIYEEGEIITFTMEYKNKSSNSAYGVALEAKIPKNTTLEDASEGDVDKDTITWEIGTLSGKESGTIVYTVKVNQLDKAEIKATNTAVISFSNSTLNPDDDTSTVSFLLYSNRFGENHHKKYIYGYEDNTFRPGNNITRAEVAAIMFNILDLEEDTLIASDYPDLTENHWAYNQIQAVTNANIFTGYEDGSFRPDNYITRAELATVLANHLGLKNIDSLEVNFADIDGHWAKNFIEEIYRVKLIQGYIENDVRVFKPDTHITRAESVTIINNMLFRGPLLGADISFDDVEETHWAYGHILESSIDHYYTRNNDETESIISKED